MKLITRVMTAAAIVLACAGACAAETVTVQLSKTLGPATYRASGFLHAMTKTTPGPEMVDPLKPKLFRMCAEDWHNTGAGGFANYDRVKKIGARMQIVVSDSHGYKLAGWWPGDDNDWSRWALLCQSLVKRAQAAKHDVEWDIWNEPNIGYFWPGDQAKWLEVWKHGYNNIRGLDQKSPIVGPSISGYNREYLEAFLLYAKKNDVVPEILSWHEFGSPRKIPEHVDQMKKFMADNGIKVRSICINEAINSGQALSPGTTLVYLANMDRAGVEGACHACWGDKDPGVSNCENQSLDGILTHPDKKPRATWWAYKAYADVTGTLVKLTPDERVDGIAGFDPRTGAITIALGKDAGEAGPVELKITGVKGDKVHVVAQRLVSSGWEESAGPVAALDADYNVEDGKVIIALQEFGQSDVYTLKVTPAK